MEIPKEIKVKTIYEAEKQIYKLITQGVPQNEITEITININEHTRHFNPSQISKIKKKLERPEENYDENKDFLTAELFKDFKNGHTVLEIVMNKGYKLDIVEAAYEKYIRHTDMEVIPKWFVDNLRKYCFELECHFAPDNPTPKNKIEFEDMNTWINDSVGIAILSDTEDRRTQNEQKKYNGYRSKEKPVMVSIFPRSY